MPGISDTAYPRLKPNPSAKELDESTLPTSLNAAGPSNVRGSLFHGLDCWFS
jgi:hypothetical protein